MIILAMVMVMISPPTQNHYMEYKDSFLFRSQKQEYHIKYYNYIQDCISDAFKIPADIRYKYDIVCKPVELEEGYAVWENE